MVIDSSAMLKLRASSSDSVLELGDGIFQVDSLLDISGKSIFGQGPEVSRIICTAPDGPAVQWSGISRFMRDLSIEFPARQIGDWHRPCLEIVNKQKDGQRGLYNSTISNVQFVNGTRGISVADGAMSFSNVWDACRVEYWSDWAYYNISPTGAGVGTGSVFNSFHGTGLARVDSAGRIIAAAGYECKGLLASSENEITLTQVNCEWMTIKETVIKLLGGDWGEISGHFEGLLFDRPYSALVTTSRPYLNLGPLLVDNWQTVGPGPFAIVNSAGKKSHLTRMDGIILRQCKFDPGSKIYCCQRLKDTQGLFEVDFVKGFLGEYGEISPVGVTARIGWPGKVSG